MAGKIIRITADNEITVHDFPTGDYEEQNDFLRGLIGGKCELYEHVMPNRLYTILGAPKQMGNAVCMLVDEEGYYHDLDVNYIGSWLYETDLHGSPIVGNILFIAEEFGDEGIDFCGLSEEKFNLLMPKFENFVKELGKEV